MNSLLRSRPRNGKCVGLTLKGPPRQLVCVVKNAAGRFMHKYIQQPPVLLLLHYPIVLFSKFRAKNTHICLTILLKTASTQNTIDCEMKREDGQSQMQITPEWNQSLLQIKPPASCSPFSVSPLWHLRYGQHFQSMAAYSIGHVKFNEHLLWSGMNNVYITAHL